MPVITSGNNTTGTFGQTDSVTITSRGTATFESPTGTVVAVFTGTRTFGPYDAQTYKITATSGDLYYEVGDGVTTSSIRVLATSAIAASITDTVGQSTTESTLATLVIPANTLGPNDGLELDMIWSCTNSAAAKRTRIRFGGTVLSNLDLTTHLSFRHNYKMRNRGSRASQVAQCNSTTTFGPVGSVGAQTFTIDFSVDQTLTITAQFPVAGTGTNTLTLEEFGIKAI